MFVQKCNKLVVKMSYEEKQNDKEMHIPMAGGVKQNWTCLLHPQMAYKNTIKHIYYLLVVSNKPQYNTAHRFLVKLSHYFDHDV